MYRVGRDGKVRWHYPANAEAKAKHVFAAPLVAGDLATAADYVLAMVAS